MTAEDIEGATYAYDDGTHWLFAHCSPAEQIGFAARAEAFAFAQFAEPIQTSNAIGARAESNGGRNTAYQKSLALLTFARKVGQRVHKVVVGATLGYYHRNPHTDYKRLITVAAIKTELQVLRQNQEADADSRAMLGRVTVAANAIVARLTSSHTVEWRHERAQRVQLEQIKKAIRGADPIDGHEYIFTAGKTEGQPIGIANRPDPQWPTDAPGLATGIVRGVMTYYDGYPLTLGPDRPYVLAFKRATGTAEWSVREGHQDLRREGIMSTQKGFWQKFSPGNAITLALVCGSILLASQRTTSRLDVLEHRIAELERVESRDFLELKTTVQKLAESLQICQNSLARLEENVSWLRDNR